MAVLFVFIFLLQDPYLLRAGRLDRDNALFSGEKRIVLETGSAGETEICYYLNGGAFLEEEEEAADALRKLPVKEGYNFAGWYRDSGFWHRADEADAGEGKTFSLYAKWTKCIDDDYNVQMYPYRNRSAAGRGQKQLKDCPYRFLSNVKIPGMPSTREADAKEKRITETSQCPQGICITEDYLLISVYSGKFGGGLGCIHVFDKSSGEYCATIGTKKNSHMGGLAYDGESVWVCHSGSRTLGRIPYAVIRQTALKKPRQVVDCSGQFSEFLVTNTPSCIAYFDGRLWVATHTKVFCSKMVAYRITKQGLTPEKSCRIPDKVQGIAFDEDGRVYISASYGRRRSSYLKVYESLEQMDRKPNRAKKKVEMPPCSEELALSDGEIYVLFESAAEKYLEGTDGKGKSIAPVDEVLAVPKDAVLE